MQALFTNPLAELGLLGVSNGAGIGLVLGVLFGSGSLWSLSLKAMAGALLTSVALGIICNVIMTWTIYFSTSLDLR